VFICGHGSPRAGFPTFLRTTSSSSLPRPSGPAAPLERQGRLSLSSVAFSGTQLVGGCSRRTRSFSSNGGNAQSQSGARCGSSTGKASRLCSTAPRPTYRPLLTTALFTGLRLGELLGLTWEDLDLDAGFIRVRKQLDRAGDRVPTKTPCAVREVELMPALARTLRAHRKQRFALGQARPEDFVFGTTRGTPFHYRNVVRRGLDAAVHRAGLPTVPRLRFHDLRHTFASLLIAEGADVVFVSRKLGHASVKTTLDVYAHLFDAAEHGQRFRAALESAFGKVVESSGGNGREPARAGEGGQIMASSQEGISGNRWEPSRPL